MSDKSTWEMKQELEAYCRKTKHCTSCIFLEESVCVASLLFNNKFVKNLYRRMKDELTNHTTI